MYLHQLQDKDGGSHCKQCKWKEVFYQIKRNICVTFLTGILKINEYTHKRKKIDLRTMPTFLSAIILENTL